MSYLTNKIDVYEFISLQGQMIPPAQTKIILDRPGVNGSEFVLTGTKGRPFSLISQVDDSTRENAIYTFQGYQRLVDGDAIEVIQGGVSSDSLGYRCAVLNVEPIAIMAIAGGVGNVFSDPPHQGFIIARWDLIAVPV